VKTGASLLLKEDIGRTVPSSYEEDGKDLNKAVVHLLKSQ